MKPKMFVLALLTMLGLLATAAVADETDGKKYKLSINQAVKVGTTELQAGEYHMILGSPKVRFVSIKSGDAVEVEATVHTADKKYSDTAITTKDDQGTRKLSQIELGGSKTKVAFP